MQLPLVTFSGLLQRMAAALQGSATTLVDLSIGSVLRASLEASASVALWLQWLILQVLATTRAATSSAADLDSWMADFSLSRLPGSQAIGMVTFARYTSGLSGTVPVGTTVRTSDGAQSYQVVSDQTNAAWNGAFGYTIGQSSGSIDVPVQAITPGQAGNVQAGAIGLLATPIAGIDTVSNVGAFVGGLDTETDAAFRARFTDYINSRSLATVTAVDFAVASVRQGLRFRVLEGMGQAGQMVPGNFTVVVDDGAGVLADELASSVADAVERVRPIGSTYSVTAPVLVPITVNMVLLTDNAATHQTVAASVVASALAWIASLPIGGSLAISKLDAIAHAADPSVLSVSGTTINMGTVDVAAPQNAVLQAVSVTVA